MRSVLFLGTSSGAGKTTLAAVFCRYLVREGYRVAPFKASNLSLNSYVTEDGKEIGMGQALQSWACGIEPEADMNPVLLKPAGGGRMQVVLGGEPLMDTGSGNDANPARLMEEAAESYDHLAGRFDYVVCEGSGSPAEINLRDRDLANIGLMRSRRVPAVLVGDIERGGVFAAIYGTWKLIPEDVRPLVRCFVINRFRGDASLLDSGIEKIEKLTGMRCAGVVPYAKVALPEEDSISGRGGRIDSEDPIAGFVADLDRVLAESEKAGVDFGIIEGISGDSSARGDLDCPDVPSVLDVRVHGDGDPVHREYERGRVDPYFARGICQLDSRLYSVCSSRYCDSCHRYHSLVQGSRLPSQGSKSFCSTPACMRHLPTTKSTMSERVSGPW